MLEYLIAQKYEELVSTFEHFCNESNCGYVKYPPISTRFQWVDKVTEDFDCCLHLQDWKARGSSAKERVDIVVHVQETIRRSDAVLLRSTVRVNYYKVDDKKAKLLQSVRFDYGKGEAMHPLFHAQTTSERIQLEQNDAAEIEFQYQFGQSEVACFKNARIPTSDMTFPSVLLCLAADHFAEHFFREFMERVLVIQDRMPQPSFEKLKASLAAESKHLRSSYWFAHMRD